MKGSWGCAAFAACFALAQAGCGFESLSHGDGGTAGDASPGGSDGGPGAFDGAIGGGDGAIAGGGDGGAPTSCAAPEVLAVVQDVSDTQHGQVLRFSLASGTPTACSPLTAGGTLSPQSYSVGWVDGLVVVGVAGGAVGIDPATDQFRFNFVSSNFGVQGFSIFAAKTPAGAIVPAIGLGSTSDGEYWNLTLVDPVKGTALYDWPLQGSSSSPLDFGFGIRDMTADPFDPTRMLLINSGDYAAGALSLPYDNVKPRVDTYYASLPNSTDPGTIYAIPSGTNGARTVFVQQPFSTSNNVYELDDDGSGPVLTGPLRCNDATACKQPLVLNHAVPDPTQSGRVFGICDSPKAQSSGSIRNVVRFDASGCTLVFDGYKLSPGLAPFSLGVHQ